MKFFPRRSLSFLSLWTTAFTLFLVFTFPARADQAYEPKGVCSDFIIHDGKVYFAQLDNTLTVLDLETGAVLARKANYQYGGTHQLLDHGMRVGNHGETALIDLNTFELIWRVEGDVAHEIEENRMVVRVGDGTIRCHDTITGKMLWSSDLPGGFDIVVEQGSVFVFRSGRYEGPNTPAVFLLDLKTGKEIFRQISPPGVHFFHAYFDGKKIYVAVGHGTVTPRFEKLIVWDIHGNEGESIPAPENFNKFGPRRDAPFRIGENLFHDSRAWDLTASDLPRDIVQAAQGYGLGIPFDSESYPLSDGTGFVKVSSGGWWERVKNVTVHLKSGNREWKGRLPYLEGLYRSGIDAVASTSEFLLFGSNYGHVECVDIKTGRSRWIYQFPAVWQQPSFDPNQRKRIDMVSADRFNKENVKSGLILDGETVSSPRIVRDPSPKSPMENLPRCLAFTWTGVIGPILFLGWMAWMQRRRSWNPGILGFVSLALSIGVFFYYAHHTRVSDASALGFRITLLATLVSAAAYSIGCLLRKQWISGPILLGAAYWLGIVFHRLLADFEM